jgi:phospholipase/carboxylesterase
MQILKKGKPLDTASKALILLHGRGGSAADILPLANHFNVEGFFIAAPQAPGNSWYPQSFMVEEHLNEPYLTNSIEKIKILIDEIAQHIPKEQIYLMGFSQGACLSLEITSRFATKYGGVVAFSGGLIGKTLNEKKYSGNFEETKVFIGNSDVDPHIPIERTKESAKLMEKMGAAVTLKIYPGMGHIINNDEITTVNQLLFS